MNTSAASGTSDRCPRCGVALPDDWDSRFMARDRAYFERHPEATSYRRLPLPNEHPFVAACSGRLMMVEVVNVAPGFRTRFGIELRSRAGESVQ